ncbi:MAG: BamA/OMP85 family outer membrane protein [Gemmatimonadaceae bacterium]
MRARRSATRAATLWLRVAAVCAGTIAGPSVVRAQDIQCDRRDAKQVHALRFEGNDTFSDDELSTRVVTTASSFTHRYFRWLFDVGTARCVPDEGLAGDIGLLENFYKARGFYQTKVDTVVTPVPPDAVDITFRITEGPPIRATSFTITGLDSVPDSSAIVQDLPIGTGRRVGALLILNAIDTINARLRNAGYPNEDVFYGFSANPAQRSATVDLQVVTGARARIGTIAIARTGAEEGRAPQIDSAIVLRLLGFRTGDWYSDRALNDARRSLYNLGAYRHVGVDLDSAHGGSDTLADVHVDLREDFLRQYQQEETWAQLDCFRVESQYSDKNFLDRALRLDLTGRVSKLGFGSPTHWGPLCDRGYLEQDSLASSKLNYYAGATVRQPTLFGGRWVPAYSAYTERRGQYKSYLRTTFIGLDVSATRNIAITTPLRFGYALEYAQTLAEPAFLCAVFSACTAVEQATTQRKLPFGVASVGLQQVRVDNTVEPRSGYIVGGEVRGSAPLIGSNQQLEFFKVTGDGSVYRPISSRATFAVRFRAGVIGGTNLPPPQERLYAGGATSVRGFQQNELGPLVYLVDSAQTRKITLPDGSSAFVTTDTTTAQRTIPTGGNRLVVLNAEARIRDPFIPNLLEYVPFIDAGEVFTRVVGNEGVPNRLSITPGLGLRFFTPIGHIQANAGYNPQKVRAGQAYMALVRPNGSAPLVCVTAPGATPAPVTFTSDGKGGIVGNVNSDCPASFTPPVSSGFFSRFVLTLSIGTDF